MGSHSRLLERAIVNVQAPNGQKNPYMYIIKIHVRFNAIHHLQSLETCAFYSHPSFYVFILGVI